MLPSGQPFATIVTKDYPGEPSSRLDRPGSFRVNVCAGSTAYREVTGHPPREATGDDNDATVEDQVIDHPVYGSLGWLAVVNPGPACAETLRELLRTAHGLARARLERRADAARTDS